MLETKAEDSRKNEGACRIVVMVSGGGTNLQAVIDRVKDGNITNTVIAGVISNNKNAYALKRAEENGIPSKCISPKDYESREIFNEKLLEAVNGYEPDLVVLAGFLVVIPPEMIAQYRNRMINIHPSLIPSFCGKGYYGLKVHEAALQRGVKVVGATVHFVDEGTDTGPIILQKAVEVEQGDTPEILQRRVMEQAEWKILPRAIDLIANGRVKVEGSHAVIGADLARRFGERPEIVHAIEAHHGDVEPNSVIDVLVQAADAISAARPGARKETLDAYIKRLEKLEEIANSYKGVERTYAIQAGREVRVMVEPTVVDEASTTVLAHDIAHQIESEMQYPGQVKVVVIRESRAVDYAK